MNQHEVPTTARFNKLWLLHAITVISTAIGLLAITYIWSTIHQYTSLTNTLKQH